jgi:hypothetical protein
MSSLNFSNLNSDNQNTTNHWYALWNFTLSGALILSYLILISDTLSSSATAILNFYLQYLSQRTRNLSVEKRFPLVGPWLWKGAKIKEEKEKYELRRRHSDCYWVEVRKRAEKMEQIPRKKVVGRGGRG